MTAAPLPAPALEHEAAQAGYATDMQQLPAALLDDDVPTAEKLVFLWVKLNPGEHSARSLSAALGVRVHNALGELVRRGVVVEEEAPAGRRPGKYRAAPLRSPRPRLGAEESN